MRINLLIIAFCGISFISTAQTITVQPRSALVMKGNIYLVLQNHALINNGRFTDSLGTVKFAGHKDTGFSYINGTMPTSIFNLTTSKTAFGTAIKSAVEVRNILGVYGGILYPDSNLTLKSDSNLTARVDVVPASCNIVGKAFVERYFPKRRAWRLVTSPLTNTPTIYNTWQNKGVYMAGINTCITGPNPTGATGNGLDTSIQNNASMKTWNYSTQALENVLNTKVPLSPGNTGKADNRGYFLFVRGDRDFNNFYIPNTNITTLSSSGNLQVGTQSFPAAAIAGGFTLIGNPYASPVDFNSINRTNLEKRFYVWDPKINLLGAYVVLDDLDGDGIYTKSIAASTQTKDLQSGQAFYVQTSSAGAAAISFTENCKSGSNNNSMFRPLPPQSSLTGPSQMIRLALNKVEAGGAVSLADGILAECNNRFSDSVDIDDAMKFTNINENLGFRRYNSILMVERRPFLSISDTLFLYLSRTTQRKYQFKFMPSNIDNPDLHAFLEDSYLNLSTPVSLADTSAIDFSVDGNAASAATDRFRIVFKNSSTLPVTVTNISAYPQNENIVVMWKVENEINMEQYAVEKSPDGIHFIKAGTKTVTGSSNAFSTYSWLDIHPFDGNNFYRVKCYDLSGHITYTQIIHLINYKERNNIIVYPNPIRDNLINLQFINQSAGNYRISLMSNTGQILHTVNIQHNGNNSSFLIRPAVKLPAAVYQLEIARDHTKIKTLQIIAQ